MCPGYSLGLKIMESSLADVLHGFNWKLLGEITKEEVSMEELFGLTTCLKTPLVMVATPNLALEMYSL